MTDPSLRWRPEKLAQDSDLIAAMLYYAGRGPSNLRVYENGTFLMVKPEGDTEEAAHRCLDELLLLPEFKVIEMKDGHFMVSSHDVGAVLILKTELEEQLAALAGNEHRAVFEGEAFRLGERKLSIGLVGRAKLWRDATEKKEIFHFVAATDARPA